MIKRLVQWLLNQPYRRARYSTPPPATRRRVVHPGRRGDAMQRAHAPLTPRHLPPVGSRLSCRHPAPKWQCLACVIGGGGLTLVRVDHLLLDGARLMAHVRTDDGGLYRATYRWGQWSLLDDDLKPLNKG